MHPQRSDPLSLVELRGAVGPRDHPLLAPHPTYVALGASPAERGQAYRAILGEAVSAEDLQAIRFYLQQQRAWGETTFRRWSKPRHGASPALALRIGRGLHPLVTEPELSHFSDRLNTTRDAIRCGLANGQASRFGAKGNPLYVLRVRR